MVVVIAMVAVVLVMSRWLFVVVSSTRRTCNFSHKSIITASSEESCAACLVRSRI